MKRKSMTNEEKLREADFISAAIARAGMQKKQFAETLGYGPSDISQWFNRAKPTKIPDLAFCKAATLLNFDPTELRPYLREMYEALELTVKSNPGEPSTVDLIRSVIDALPESQRVTLLQGLKREDS